MKLVATELGLCIPKEYLGEAREFEVVREQDKIIITGVKNPTSI